MITYRKDKSRHTFSFSTNDMADLAELIYLLKHTPPPVGFNRRPLTTAQQRVLDNLYDLINYGDGYAEVLNRKTGQ